VSGTDWPDATVSDPCAELRAENKRLRGAVLDIDAHAAPLGRDEDGFVAGGYIISVGCLHRALGLVGHSAAKCTETPCSHDGAHNHLPPVPSSAELVIDPEERDRG